MKTSYCKMHNTENSALQSMRLKNQACRKVGNRRDIFVVTEGPDGNWAVMDIKSAIDLGACYQWME